MIRYSLACDRGHEFESWFRGSDDFDAQKKRGFVTCPVCDSAKVSKQIMAPSVARKDKPRVIEHNETPAAAEPAEAPAPVALIDSREQQLRAMLRAIREQVVANSENVGKKFAEEARKIHYGETEQRSIYGEASPDDAKALHEEGIEFLPLPVVPDERN